MKLLIIKKFLRLGDGDFRIICGHNCTINYQSMDINLKKDLNDLLNSKNKNLLICLPNLLKKNWLNEYFINNINNENKLLDSRFSRMIKIKNNIDTLWNNKVLCWIILC